MPYSSTNNTVNKLLADGQSMRSLNLSLNAELMYSSIAVKFDNPNYGHVIDEYVLRNYPVIDW